VLHLVAFDRAEPGSDEAAAVAGRAGAGVEEAAEAVDVLGFICGPAWNRPIAAAIPAARYIEIADSGHVPQYEQPDVFRDALLGWLAATCEPRSATLMPLADSASVIS
jgi:pimeloyl-ACP methyl ester carboxylesterase